MKENKTYSIEEAIKNIKERKNEKFDGTVEVHINLDLDVSKSDQMIRYSVVLPHGTGKSKKVAVLASTKISNADIQFKEEDLDAIEKGKIKPKIDFDVFVAETKFMPKIAKVAKILGPAGVMPNPKTGTVSDDVEKAVEQIKKGKIEVKTEKELPIIHTIIGKVSFEEKELVDNFNELISSLKQNKPLKSSPDWIKTIFISSTMGPSIRISLS
ncbi:MAG TPA: 50S ribosomal protein L1 [bacterium]|jgi:large subunit ribosomal protein L1|nr:50S ribosomal protein L1 [bacterium]